MPYCYPVTPDEFETGVHWHEERDGEPYEDLSDESFLVVEDDEGAVAGFAHVAICRKGEEDHRIGLEPIEELLKDRIGLIRFLHYRAGSRPAGQALLEAAETHLRSFGIDQIRGLQLLRLPVLPLLPRLPIRPDGARGCPAQHERLPHHTRDHPPRTSRFHCSRSGIAGPRCDHTIRNPTRPGQAAQHGVSALPGRPVHRAGICPFAGGFLPIAPVAGDLLHSLVLHRRQSDGRTGERGGSRGRDSDGT